MGSGPSSKGRATGAGDQQSVCITLIVALSWPGCGIGASFALGAAAERDVQLLELLFRDGTGGVHHLVAGGLGLGKRHHLTDVRLVRKEHHQTVYPWCDPTVGRRAVAEGGEDGSEPPVRLLRSDTDDVEDLLLQVGVMDPHTPRGELSAVGYEVVQLADDLQRVGIEQRQIVFARHGEHVVHRLDAPLVLVPLEEREVRHPAHTENVRVGEPEAVSEVEPQAAQALEDDGVLVRDEEQPVAFSGPERFAQSCLLLLREELRDGALQAIRLHQKVGQAPGPSRGCDGGEVVELPAGQVPQSADRDAAHRAARFYGPREDLELRIGGELRDVVELQAEADIRLIRAEAVHRLGVGKAGEGFGEESLLRELLDDPAVEAFDEVQDLVLRRVAHLQVELRVFGLAVPALVLVAQCAGYLEVSFEASHHQELLELLWGLWERVELPWIEAGRDQVVPGAFRGRCREERGFDLHEAPIIEVVAHVLDDAVAEQDLVTHPLPAQVEVAVLQAECLVNRPVPFDLERRCLRGVQNFESRSLDLYHSCRQIGVLVALWSAHHLALYGDGPLGPELLGRSEDPVPFRVECDLCNAPAVAQVYEDQTTMVPSPVYPACEPDSLPGVVFA